MDKIICQECEWIGIRSELIDDPYEDKTDIGKMCPNCEGIIIEEFK